MSKFKVIDGKGLDFQERTLELRQLEFMVTTTEVMTNKHRLTFAYHYARLGHPLKAVSFLNKVSEYYFDFEIFRDLFQATLGELLARQDADNGIYQRQYEFYLIVRRSIPIFLELEFKNKEAFHRFVGEFEYVMNELEYNHGTSDL